MNALMSIQFRYIKSYIRKFVLKKELVQIGDRQRYIFRQDILYNVSTAWVCVFNRKNKNCIYSAHEGALKNTLERVVNKSGILKLKDGTQTKRIEIDRYIHKYKILFPRYFSFDSSWTCILVKFFFEPYNYKLKTFIICSELLKVLSSDIIQLKY